MKQFPFYGLSGCSGRSTSACGVVADCRRASAYAVSAAERFETALRWLDRLLLIELVALTFLLGCFLDKDTDIWWHLRAGREILGGAGIPRIDSYIFAAPGAEWIDLHWGFQATAAWLFSRGRICRADARRRGRRRVRRLHRRSPPPAATDLLSPSSGAGCPPSS